MVLRILQTSFWKLLDSKVSDVVLVLLEINKTHKEYIPQDLS